VAERFLDNQKSQPVEFKLGNPIVKIFLNNLKEK
jgi:hypothetical protein